MVMPGGTVRLMEGTSRSAARTWTSVRPETSAGASQPFAAAVLRTSEGKTYVWISILAGAQPDRKAAAFSTRVVLTATGTE